MKNRETPLPFEAPPTEAGADAELQGLYQERTAAGDAAGCPAPEELYALATAELSEERRSALADHLAECSDCVAEYRMIRSLEGWSEDLAQNLPELSAADRAPSEDTAIPTGAPVIPLDERRKAPAPQDRRWLRRLASAAALIVLLGGGLALRLSQGTPETPDGRRTGAPTLTTPEDRAVLAAPPAQLRWKPQQGAALYQVQVFDASAEVLWESPASERSFLALPPEATAQLSAGGSFFWVVEIEGTARRGRLGPFWFEIAPAQE